MKDKIEVSIKDVPEVIQELKAYDKALDIAYDLLSKVSDCSSDCPLKMNGKCITTEVNGITMVLCETKQAWKEYIEDQVNEHKH